jgi:hypothetical protein
VSKAFKCDRCATFNEGDPAFVIEKQSWALPEGGSSGLRNYQSPQFCATCARDYERWMRREATQAVKSKLATTAAPYRALKGQPGFIPQGEKEDCPSRHDDGEAEWCCTRDRGHDGDHAAHVDEDEMVARWPQ